MLQSTQFHRRLRRRPCRAGAARSSGSRSPASARPRCRSRSRVSATRTRAGQSRCRRSCAPTSSAAACSAASTRRGVLDETQPAGDGRMARPRRRRAGRRLGHAAGRRPLRRALQAVGRGQGRRARRPEQRGRSRPTCAWRRTASPTTSTKSSPARRACSRPASPTSRRAATASRCAWPMPTAKAAQVALNSPEPIISPAWSPDGRELAYVSFESQKAVVYVQDVATRQAPRDRQLPRLEQRAGLVARRPARWRVTLSRDGGSQLYLMGRDGDNAAPPDEQHRDRHRAGVLARRPHASTSSATAAAARRSTACRPAAARPSASPSTAATTSARRSAPTAARSPTSRAQGNAFRLYDDGRWPAAAAQALTDTSDDESPSFAPNGRLIIYATRAQGRDVLMTTTLDGKIKARLVSTTADVREPVWGPFGR